MWKGIDMLYIEAMDIASKARDKVKGKPVAGHSRIVKDGDNVALVLHTTAILTWHRDGKMTLNTGGWYSATTKRRLNEFLPQGWNIKSRKGKWTLFMKGQRVAPFVDGIIIDTYGRVHGGGEGYMQIEPSEVYDLRAA